MGRDAQPLSWQKKTPQSKALRCFLAVSYTHLIKVGQSYSALINELLDEDGAKKVALEDKTLTYTEFMSLSLIHI